MELPSATPSDAVEKPLELKPSEDDITELPLTTSQAAVATPSLAMKKAAPDTDTVSTGEELFQWLSDHGDTGGVITLSDDIYLRDFIYVHGFRQPAVTIDTGEFSIIVADGYAELHAGGPLTIRGHGGEDGVLRAAEGGMLQISGLTLEAEEGYAAFQEEGAGLLIEQNSVSGPVHYAKLPYVLEWEDVLVVEERGQIFDEGHLPAVLRGRVIRQGRITDFYEDVPVTWDMTGHEEAQKRQRFTVTGEFENMASPKTPVCTVVYDDFPLTFLEVKARRITGERGDVFKFTGDFSKPEDRLPITIAQEYSFDGEHWILYEEAEVDRPNGTFTIYLSAGTGEPEPQVIFIRLSWDDGGTMYYSNVLRFAGDSLEESGEQGGNRGGGTDIINPPGDPEPEPEPSKPGTSQPAPVRPGNNDTDYEAGGELSSVEDFGGYWDTQEPAQEDSVKTVLSGGPSPASSEPSSNPALESSPAGEAVNPLAGTGGEPEGHAGIPSDAEEPPSVKQQEGTPGGTLPMKPPEAPEGAAVKSLPPSPKDNMQDKVKTRERSAPRRPNARSAAAGLAAIAVSMGGAALYLHPKAQKKIIGLLRDFFKW